MWMCGEAYGGYELWIDYALSKNPEILFVIGVPWIDFPHDYDAASYGSTYAEGIETIWTGPFGTLRALYPDVEISFTPCGFAAIELRYRLEAGQPPGITDPIGDSAQTSLFRDNKGHGHAGGLVLDLAECIWSDTIFHVDLDSYGYDAGHGIDLKDVAQSIL